VRLFNSVPILYIWYRTLVIQAQKAMKKIFFLILLTGFASQAQLFIGPKVGGLLATHQYGNALGFDAKLKFSGYGGAFAEYKRGKFAIVIDVLYADAGSNLEITSGKNSESPIRTKAQIDTEMVTANLQGKYFFTDKVSVNLGFYYGELTGPKLDYDSSDLSDIDLRDIYATGDYGITLGGTYFFYNSFFADIKYSFGLQDISTADWNSHHYNDNGQDYSVKNRFLMVGIGYRFQLTNRKK